ncbi:SseB family protein [Streptomyces sp. NPDC101227]|uniref:SseB family protein n=1 Tax=Streptomyces sp. NPDC101227 TaxID=3366136 RepID=UPI0038110595
MATDLCDTFNGAAHVREHCLHATLLLYAMGKWRQHAGSVLGVLAAHPAFTGYLQPGRVRLAVGGVHVVRAEVCEVQRACTVRRGRQQVPASGTVQHPGSDEHQQAVRARLMALATIGSDDPRLAIGTEHQSARSGIRWVYAFTDEEAMAHFATARGAAREAELEYVRAVGARLLDVVVPAIEGPAGVAVNVGGEQPMLFPPVSGIVPDAAALDLVESGPADDLPVAPVRGGVA